MYRRRSLSKISPSGGRKTLALVRPVGAYFLIMTGVLYSIPYIFHQSPLYGSWTVQLLNDCVSMVTSHSLHQTEDKTKVHGCINSSKFLVAEGYRVKVRG